MDGPTPATPPAPTPYRDGKPLAEIIPPDRRRAKAAALVLASMVAGITLWVGGGWVIELLTRDPVVQPAPPSNPGYAAGRIAPATLQGPGGAIPMPPSVRTVIHVWLQGCQDCMPAFEAMRDLEDRGGLGVSVPIVNVAYGEADTTWAERYRVNKNLVFDVGGASVVKPLGIGTFTTLVVDSNGAILLRDRPDRPGYRDRVRAAVGRESVLADRVPDVDPVRQRGGLEASEVELVVSQQRTTMRRACWDDPNSSAITSVSVTVTLVVAPDGNVRDVSSTGSDARIAKCIEAQTRTWRFPAHEEASTLNIPFKFVRQ